MVEEKLVKLIKNAYAPYSHYKVACIVVTKDDKEFEGVNVEDASYGATICAERNAIDNAVASGYTKGDFKSIHIMNETDQIAYPCFLCRQTFTEFFDMDNEVYLYDKNGFVKKVLMQELLPDPFTSENLNS